MSVTCTNSAPRLTHPSVHVVLHQVVGLGPILGEAKGQRSQGAEVVERLVIERRRPVLAESAHATFL